MTQSTQAQFDEAGFVVIPGFAPQLAYLMLDCARELARRKEAGGDVHDALFVEESKLSKSGAPLANRLSKIFRVHVHEPLFHDFATRPEVLRLVSSLLGGDFDCFLSQFIFKMPGALGQPWHQDAFYFPFEHSRQIGLWYAVTEAHATNGPLWVLPGSHRESVHNAVKDQREHANPAYVEIVDHTMDGAVPVYLQPGDLLVFHSHLMHRSTDNDSAELRAAMVYHYATAGTVDNSEQRFGRKPANQEWLPVMRNGVAVR